MTRILGMLKGRRIAYGRSFSASLESKDRGLHYRAIVCYRWRLDPHSSAPHPLAPDPLVRHVLREELGKVARKHRLLNHEAAEDALNAALSQELRDVEQRVRIEGSVRLRITKQEKRAALQRAEEETALRSAHARQTVELELLLDRLTDQVLGPVWWVNRYADLQFATGDPRSKVESILGAFATLQDKLHAAEIDQVSDEKLLVRRKIEEVFSVIEDEQSLSLALEVMNRTLEHLGLRGIGGSAASLTGTGRNLTQEPPSAS